MLNINAVTAGFWVGPKLKRLPFAAAVNGSREVELRTFLTLETPPEQAQCQQSSAANQAKGARFGDGTIS